MSEKRDQIIERIKKLLALAGNNPSAEEATAAALMAQRFISEYDVEEHELAEEAEAPIKIGSGVGTGKAWKVALAQAIADNFRCKVFMETYSGRGGKCIRDIVFFGYKLDAEAAKLTYEHLYKAGNRLANAAARTAREVYGTAVGVYNRFALGFVSGVRSELEIQATALMIVVPPAVSEAFDAMNLSTSRYGARFNRKYACPYNAWDDGEEAGREAVRKSRLGKGEYKMLAETA